MDDKNLEFTKPQNYIRTVLENIESYNTKQEKEFLLMDDPDISGTCKTLGHHALNDLEGLYVLQKKREKSVSDLYEQLLSCPSCQEINDIKIELKDVGLDVPGLKELESTSKIPVGLFTDLEDFMNPEVVESLSITDYNTIQKEMTENNLKIYAHTVTRQCKCQADIPVHINPLNILSKTNVANIYTEYFDLSFYTHFTKADVDGMLPFERQLFYSLLKKKIDKPA